jgi:hypothetical protein
MIKKIIPESFVQNYFLEKAWPGPNLKNIQ